MKNRFLIVFSAFLIFVFFCGCSGYRESNSRYIVAAVGFDNKKGEILATAQLLIIGEDTDESPSALAVSAAGADCRQALYNLGPKLTKPFLYDHCGIVACGTNLNSEQFNDVLDFCREETALNLSVNFICCKNPFEVLACPPVDFPAGGYDIMGIIDRAYSENGINFRSRYYELYDKRNDKNAVFSIPFFDTADKKAVLGGEYIYKGDVPLIKLDESEMLLYSIICNDNSGGRLQSGDEYADVNSCSTNFSADFDEDMPKVEIKTHLYTEKKSREFTQSLESDVYRLISRTKSEGVGDIFGFGSKLRLKYPKKWDEIKNNYEKIYENDLNINYSAE